mgnify:FL=1
MNVTLLGKSTALFKALSEVINETDTLTEFNNDVSSLKLEAGDIVFIASEDFDFIKRVRIAIPLYVPLIAFTQKSTWFTLVDSPGISVLHAPLTMLKLRNIIEDGKAFSRANSFLLQFIAGSSRKTQELRNSIIYFAKNFLPLHLNGETGTGKTLAAKLINSLQNNKKELVYINCANLNSAIADSDLFGHTKGAFTNAVSPRKGLINQANESTLFLDEIENLPLDKQGKLLDTIENGFYRNIGDDSTQKSTFRLITAAQSSLEELVDRKKLRKDFYYRISNLSITISPLRDHKEDIPEIVLHYENKNKIEKGRIADCTPLMQSDWKGNIRELIHYLDRVFSHVRH